MKVLDPKRFAVIERTKKQNVIVIATVDAINSIQARLTAGKQFDLAPDTFYAGIPCDCSTEHAQRLLDAGALNYERAPVRQ